MFLGPQHFQSFSREIYSRIFAGSSAGAPGPFGVLELQVDEDALARDVFAVENATLILRDGTLVCVPRNARVEQREFDDHWAEGELIVYLGIPAVGENVEQAGDDSDRRYRFKLSVDQVFDENLRDSEREVEFRELQCAVFFGGENRSGYDCLPIARIKREGHPDPTSVLSTSYVPPILRLGGCPALQAKLLSVAKEVRSQARDLAVSLPDTTRLSSVESAADMTGLIKLQAVNRTLAVLEQLASTPDVHPYLVYMELVRGIGDLALFSTSRTTPELQVYAHEDLNSCFDSAFEALDELLSKQVQVPYDRVEFESDPGQEGVYHATIPPDWLKGRPIFYLGVQSSSSSEEAGELVGAGVKLLAPQDSERVLRGVLPGVGLEQVRIPPLSFPNQPDLHFFRVEVEGDSRDLWLNVLRGRKAMLLSALGALGDIAYGIYVELRP